MSHYLQSIGNFLYEFYYENEIDSDNLLEASNLLMTNNWAQAVHIFRVVLEADFNINSHVEFQRFLTNCNRFIVGIARPGEVDVERTAIFFADLANYIKSFDNSRAKPQISVAESKETFLENLLSIKSTQSKKILILPTVLEVNKSDGSAFRKRVRLLAKEFPILFDDNRTSNVEILAETFNTSITLLNFEIYKGFPNLEKVMKKMKALNANASAGKKRSERTPLTPDSSIGQPKRIKSKSKPTLKPTLESISPTKQRSKSKQSNSKQLTPKEKQMKKHVRILCWMNMGSGKGVILRYQKKKPSYCIWSRLPEWLQEDIGDAPKYEREVPRNQTKTRIQYSFHNDTWFCAKKTDKEEFYLFSYRELEPYLESKKVEKWFKEQKLGMTRCKQVKNVKAYLSDAPDD